MVLLDLQSDLILGLNWKFNYKIGCIWNIKGHQYMIHKTSIHSKVM